ncbi:hypothetical protein QOZ80_4AG0312360 [Eleusine coracana subsp. coracana]|nr:hypothetical protein QOZ80_4AG0312360 [Eleusine coracana subsp. coracana]
MSWSEPDVVLFAAVLGRHPVHERSTTPTLVDRPSTALVLELQARLHNLVEWGDTLTYNIFWKGPCVVLGWGDGHCRHDGADG